MELKRRIAAFAKLGDFLSQFSQDGIYKNEIIEYNEPFFDSLKMLIDHASEFNGWFTKDNVLYAIESWSKLLNYKNLEEWSSNYEFKDDFTPKTIAIITAGNIPLVGFHDLLSVLISGNKVLVKQSSNDNKFLPILIRYLEHIEPEFKGYVVFTDDKLSGFDAAIATGSNNTARYFEYYFGKYPNIIRRNRNSVAVLTGQESEDELKALGEDIFTYFGLGCRSVSKLFVPENYDFNLFFGAIYEYNHIIEYKKYENNYDYNKAVYLMSEFDLLENGFLMLKEDSSYSSPIATIFYEYYDTPEALKTKLLLDSDQIQSIVARNFKGAVAFGQTQKPGLTDYADGVDTMAFISQL